MKKVSTICASLLLAAAGAANANVQTLISDTSTHTYSTNSDTIATYTLAKAQTGNVLVDFNFSYAGTLGNNDFLGFWFGPAKNASTDPGFGLKANGGDGSTTSDLFARTGGTAGSFAKNSDVKAGTTYNLMAYLSKTNGSATYDLIQLWVNPTAAEMKSLTGADAFYSGASIASFDTVGFRTANIDGNVSVTVSDLTVSAVPEPTTLSLMGLAAAGLGFLRRRKNA
jgi:hypothetical protein